MYIINTANQFNNYQKIIFDLADCQNVAFFLNCSIDDKILGNSKSPRFKLTIVGPSAFARCRNALIKRGVFAC